MATCSSSLTGKIPWTEEPGGLQSESASASEVAQSRPRGVWPTRLLRPWDSPGKNTGVGCHFLLQEIFPTQGSNPGIEPGSPTLEADALTSEPPGKPWAIV